MTAGQGTAHGLPWHRLPYTHRFRRAITADWSLLDKRNISACLHVLRHSSYAQRTIDGSLAHHQMNRRGGCDQCCECGWACLAKPSSTRDVFRFGLSKTSISWRASASLYTAYYIQVSERDSRSESKFKSTSSLSGDQSVTRNDIESSLSSFPDAHSYFLFSSWPAHSLYCHYGGLPLINL